MTGARVGFPSDSMSATVATGEVLSSVGDCCFSVLGGTYRVLCRVDDADLEMVFATEFNKTLEYISGILAHNKQIDLMSLDPNKYKHFPIVVKEFYNFSFEQTENLKNKIASGYFDLEQASGVQLQMQQVVVDAVIFSLFLQFRHTVMNLKEFPVVNFAIPNDEKEVLRTSKFASTLLSQPHGDA